LTEAPEFTLSRWALRFEISIYILSMVEDLEARAASRSDGAFIETDGDEP